MKIIFRNVATAGLVIIASCGKDYSSSVSEEIGPELLNQETVPLAADTVSDNVIIKGSTKEEGMPPTPNEMISLDIADSGKAAFLNEGFEVRLSSDSDVIGAYLQFKDKDGAVSKSYYDIDLSANGLSDKAVDLQMAYGFFSGNATAQTAKNDNAFILDVDFNSTVEPGTFCYLVCVYDGNGNISAPEEVCGTVESWGGNVDLVGTWNFTKTERTVEGVTETVLVGENDCNELSLPCQVQELKFDSCIITESISFTLTADGTFSYEYKTIRNDLSYEASSLECEPIFNDDYEFAESFEGFWAFNETESRLSLIFYDQVRITNGESETRSFEAGEGILLSDSLIQLDGTTLIRINKTDYDGDGIADDEFRSFSEKSN